MENPVKRTLDGWKLLLFTAAAAIAAGFLAVAQAAPAPQGPPGPMPAWMMSDPRHLQAMAERLLADAGASAEQRTQVRTILSAAAADLAAQRESGRALRAQAQQIFLQPSVDAAAAESLRQKLLAQQDQASRRMVLAMLDVSSVLSVEQRQRLVAAMAAPPMHRHGPPPAPPPGEDATR